MHHAFSKIKNFFRHSSKRVQKIRLLLLTMLLGFTAIVALVSAWFIYTYWYPPVQVFEDTDIGKEAVLETNMGIIEIALVDTSRFTVAQFTRLARIGFYDGTRIHRIVPDLLIEGGDPLTKDVGQRNLWGEGGSAHTFKNDIHIGDQMVAGTVAMSGSSVGTYGSHFMIVTKDTPWMKGAHTIIGHVTYGMDIVHAIERLPHSVTGLPNEDIILYRVTVL